MRSIKLYAAEERISEWEAAKTVKDCQTIIETNSRAMDVWFSSNKPAVIMCPPTYYEVDKGSGGDDVAGNGFVKNGYDAYFKNPEHNHAIMQAEWQKFHDILQSKGVDIILMEPSKGLPDQVFSADHSFSCVLYSRTNQQLLQQKAVTILSRLAHPNRGEEVRLFAEFMAELRRNLSMRSLVQQRDIYQSENYLEGCGDNVIDPCRGIIISGYGLRNVKASLEMLHRVTGLPVYGVACKKPFFHVDTFFSALPNGYVMYAPDVMYPESVAALEAALFKGHPELKEQYAIPVSAEDAYRFACNAVIIGKNVMMQECSDALKSALRQRGLDVTYTTADIANYAGGGLHCMSNVFNQPVFS